jgi:hypothetical protein
MSKATPLPLREVPKTRSAAEIEKRYCEEGGKLDELRQRTVAVEQERALRLKSDPDVTAADLSEFDRRKNALAEQLKSGEELVAALADQLQQAHAREWSDKKTKRRADLEKRAATADALYEQLADQLTAVEKTLCLLKELDWEIVAFNRTSNESVGFLQQPEKRIRGHQPALWDDLAKVRRVYPGDGLIEIKVGNLPTEEGPPKPPAPPKAVVPAREQPKFFSLRPPQTDEPPAEERAPSLLHTVHRLAPSDQTEEE